MRHSPWSFVALALLALFAGCVPGVSLRVIQKVPVQQPNERIYVVVHEGAAPPSFASALAEAMVSRLGAHAGTFKSAVLTGVEFDTGFLERDIETFRAHAVLQVKPIATQVSRYGTTTAVTYSATLFDAPSKRGLWAAKVEAHAYAQPMSSVRPPGRSDSAGAWAGEPSTLMSPMSSALEAVAEKIVVAMAADQMIPPVPRPNGGPRTGTPAERTHHDPKASSTIM